MDFTRGVINVAQRADKWGTIDVTKSEAGEREVPVPALVINALREWKLQCPRRDTGKKDADGKPILELHYVFPNSKGRVESHENIRAAPLDATSDRGGGVGARSRQGG